MKDLPKPGSVEPTGETYAFHLLSAITVKIKIKNS